MSWYGSAPRHVIERADSAFPVQLAETPYAPERLFVIGSVEALRPSLSIIGARKATPYGLAATEMLAGWAARAGYVITSGAAIGCDQAAHRAAVAHGTPTVAVLAGGADVAYPRGATDLLGDVIAGGGAVVSEHRWGSEPKRWTFNTRNRIIAGLGLALLVVEAAMPSGTFTTADYALAADRTLFVVPGSIFSPTSRGTNHLLTQGACPVTDPTDLATGLEPILGAPLLTLTAHSSATEKDHLLAALRADPMRPDDLARTVGDDIVSVARRLGALETAGVVRRFPDGRYGAISGYNALVPTEESGP